MLGDECLSLLVKTLPAAVQGQALVYPVQLCDETERTVRTSVPTPDGLHRVKDDGICVDKGGRWDTNKAFEPCVIDLDDGRFRMFYEACDGEGRWRIASATSGVAADGDSAVYDAVN